MHLKDNDVSWIIEPTFVTELESFPFQQLLTQSVHAILFSGALYINIYHNIEV